jgi:phosphohistidine swiveling domain-containing protein
MKQTDFIPLETTKYIDEKLVGTKAAGLVRMKRICISVPAGFCITGTVFREHLEKNNLIGRIRAALDELAKTKPAARVAVLSSLRQAVTEAPLSEEVQRQIENHYRQLGAERVAVRSSGTAEDLPGHSFAGQYDTYLGIANLKDCIEAVKKCWASLWTLRAYEYRERNGFDHLKINMAVIVQSLVAADASGVIFTADPATGERGNMVIEACFGLGEALVSGKVTPDRFVVDKRNFKLLARTISEKKIECVLDKNGLVKELNVPKERSTVCCLDKKQVKRLAKLARKVEAEFGCPQDIEWAICKKKIYFLQSRPITAIGPEKSRQEQQIWSTFALEEVMPDVVTPVTWSMLQCMGNNLFDPSLRTLCINRLDTPVFDIIAGRIYFNASFWTAVIMCFPGLRNYDFRKNAGNETGLLDLLEKLENIEQKDLPKIEFHRIRFILKLPLLLIRTIANTPKKGQSILANAKSMNKKLQSLDISDSSPEQITEYLKGVMVDLDQLIINHAPYLFSVMSAFPALEIVCAKWLSDDGSCAKKLLAGLGNMDDAQSAIDLWRVALKAHESPDIEMVILAGDRWQDIAQKLPTLQRGDEFLKSWDEFMERHGHHCRAELELYNPRWYETPDYILGLIRSYITCIGKTDPLENCKKLAYQREQLAAGCRRELKNPIKHLIFNKLLIRSQKGAVFRENIKSEVIRLIAVMRQLLLELGNRFANQGLLAEADDIFFLEFRDINQIAKGRHKLNIRQIVAARRSEYKKWQSITPPKVVVGEYDPDSYVPEVVDANFDVLKGWAVSSGVAEGKARVILRADTDEQVLAGEILVAPFTDPGWTPYFLPAAAVVMNQGSLLSHGSIVAREYGIPCVVNVGPATRIIKTGQLIQVDGNSGVVRILK